LWLELVRVRVGVRVRVRVGVRIIIPAIFTLQSRQDTRILAGLISLCITLAECIYFRPNRS
jgi:hypothetical protein